MKVIKTRIPEITLFEPTVFEDERGFFLESFRESWFDEVAPGTCFVQDNHSLSCKGTLRGLHYQLDHPQGKLVRVIAGEVFDIAVDIRKSSPTFGQWVGQTLSSSNRHVMWVPAGFAHGFLVLSETAEFVYKCTTYYEPDDQQGIAFDDPTIGITWPTLDVPLLLSDKDRAGPALGDARLFD